MSVELASAFVSLVPSFRGATGAIAKELGVAVKPAAEQASKSIGEVFQARGAQMQDVGKKMTKGVTLPLLGIGATAWKMSGSFEAAMNGVRAVTGATGSELDAMSDLAKDMGSTTAFSASQAANAMEFLGMAGFSTQEILAGLPDVLNLAAAGNTDLATTADIASNIMSGFGIEAAESGRVADVLAQAMRSANVDLGMLGESMKYAAPLAQAAGWSFEDTAAAVGFLGNAGIQGSMAGTSLNSILATLADTSSTGGRKLKEFGVAAADSSGNVRPLTDIIDDLADKGADVSDVMSIFGLEAGPKLQALIGQGADGLREFADGLRDSEGAAKEMADIRMEGAVGSTKELASAFEGLMIALGESGLLEAGTAFVKQLTGIVQGLAQTNPEMLRTVTIVGAVVAAIGPLLIIGGKLLSLLGTSIIAFVKFGVAIGKAGILFGKAAALIGVGIGKAAAVVGIAVGKIIAGFAMLTVSVLRYIVTHTLAVARTVAGWVLMGAQSLIQAAKVAAAWLIAMGPIGIVIAAVAGLVAVIIANWDTITSVIAAAWDWVTGVTSSAWTSITGAVRSAVDKVLGWIDGLKQIPASIRRWLVEANRWIRSQFDGAVGFVRGAVSRFVGFVRGLSRIPGMIGGWIRDAYARVRDWFGRIVGFVRGIPSKVGSALSTLASALTAPFRAAFNGIASFWNNTVGRISFTIPSWVPGVGGKGFSVPNIPMLAHGGIATGPTLAMVGEGSEDEAILPLSKLDGMLGDRADHVVLDVTGGDQDLVRVIKKWVRNNAGGNVSLALGGVA